MLLVNRPRHLPYERLESYLERLRQANYYEKLRWYDDLLVSPIPEHIDLLRAACHFSALSDATGLSVDVLHSMTLHRFIDAFSDLSIYRQYYSQISAHADVDRPLWDARHLPTYLRGNKRMAVCSQCYKEHHAFLLPWVLRHVTTCLLHNILLVDRCPVCKWPLQVDLPSGSCRKCQTRIEDFPTFSIAQHAHSRHLTNLVWSALGCGTAPFPPPDLPIPTTHPLWSMAPSTFLTWLWRTAELITEYDPKNPLFHSADALLGMPLSLPDTNLHKWSLVETHRGFCAVWRIFSEWPDSWNETVTRITMLDLYRPQGRPKFLEVVAGEFRGEKWGWLQHQKLPATRLAIIEKEVALEQKGRQAASLEYSAIEMPHDRNIASLRLGDVATLLHAPHTQVTALVAAGMLDVWGGLIPNDIRDIQICSESIHRLLHSILCSIPVHPFPSAGSSLPLSFRRILDLLGRKGVTLPRLLNAIQNGELPAYRADETLSLSTIWSPSKEVRAYRERLRQIDVNNLVSAEKLCQQINCHPLMLRRLYANGLLLPMHEVLTTNPIQWWYEPQDVEAFVKQQMPAVQARNGLGARAFGQYLRELRLLDGFRVEDVVNQLMRAPFRLQVLEHKIYQWEDGKCVPDAVEKAALITVLRGSAEQADGLLLFPEVSNDVQANALTAELHAIGDQIPIMLFETQSASLAEIYGADAARHWIKERTFDNLSAYAHGLTRAQQLEILNIFSSVAAKSGVLANWLLDFGYFLLQKTEDEKLP